MKKNVVKAAIFLLSIMPTSWLQSCSSAAICCAPIPTKIQFVILDSAGINRSSEVFPSLQISYIKDGRKIIVTDQIMLQEGLAGQYSSVIVTWLHYIAEDNNIRDFVFAVNTTPLGTVSILSQWRDKRLFPQEVRFNGTLLQPLLNTANNERYLYALTIKK
jgi:hypothetical protein